MGSRALGAWFRDDERHLRIGSSSVPPYYSTISRVTLRFFRAATAFRIVRIDWTFWPCLPITRPRSSFATRSSKIVTVLPAVSGDLDRFGLGDQSLHDRLK